MWVFLYGLNHSSPGTARISEVYICTLIRAVPGLAMV